MAHHPLRLYTDLAWLWPLWGDHETEYAQYCEYLLRLFDQHARRPLESLLVISCGGGKNVYSLKKRYRVTGLDLSPVMLELAAGLNPECEFVEGDMRHFALGRRFDAILLDDGVSHMTSRADLKAAVLEGCVRRPLGEHFHGLLGRDRLFRMPAGAAVALEIGARGGRVQLDARVADFDGRVTAADDDGAGVDQARQA
jgi:SAM-dependent methyltransferase